MSSRPGHSIPNYRADIDGLRAVAVLLVVAYHAFPTALPGGFVGVDIFFVISGFLITGIILTGLARETFTVSDFYVRRVKRIFPSLLAVLAACYVTGWFTLHQNEFMELGKHTAGGVAFVANILHWQDAGYFDMTEEFKPLLHLWSLGIEEQFYLLWPLALLFAAHRGIGVTPVIAGCAVISFGLNVALVSRYADATFYLPFTRFWELLIGAGLAALARQDRFNRMLQGLGTVGRNAMSAAGACLIALATAALKPASVFPGWWALAPTLGAAFLIAGGASAWINSRVLSRPAMVGIGLISYPLYLWHWPALSFMRITVGEQSYLLGRAAAVAASVLLAWLSYEFIEKPVRFGLRVRRVVPSLLALSASIGCLGFAAYRLDGLAWRVPERITQLPTELQEMLNISMGSGVADIDIIWRQHRCFLAKGETAEQFADECLESGKRPLVFIWGDSHAAALYPGFHALQASHNFGIAQFTSSLCPPTINWKSPDNGACEAINAHNLDVVKRLRPDVVVLQAQWATGPYELQRISDTVAALQEADIPRIVITGASPGWSERVPRNVVAYFRKYGRLPPRYTTFGLTVVEETLKADEFLAAEAAKHKVEFVSIFRTLCTDEGCPLRAGDAAEEVTSFDQGHLSPAGARLFVTSAADRIFGRELESATPKIETGKL